MAELGRAALLATIPAAALLGLLQIEQLYVVGFLAGTQVLGFVYTALSPLRSVRHTPIV